MIPFDLPHYVTSSASRIMRAGGLPCMSPLVPLSSKAHGSNHRSRCIYLPPLGDASAFYVGTKTMGPCLLVSVIG